MGKRQNPVDANAKRYAKSVLYDERVNTNGMSTAGAAAGLAPALLGHAVGPLGGAAMAAGGAAAVAGGALLGGSSIASRGIANARLDRAERSIARDKPKIDAAKAKNASKRK